MATLSKGRLIELGLLAPIVLKAVSVAANRARPSIAVVSVRDVIGEDVTSDEFIAELEKAIERNSIEAIVVDINSPGGSALDSALIQGYLQHIGQEIPVVAWISGMGASGGYYIACGAELILASPNAEIGSIGVYANIPDASELMSRLGVRVRQFKSSDLKGIGSSPMLPMTPAAEEHLQKEIEETYQQFKAVVREARGFSKRQVDRVATAEMWRADKAQKLGLVDDAECVTEAQAIEVAEELAGLQDARIVRVLGEQSVLKRLKVRSQVKRSPLERALLELVKQGPPEIKTLAS